MQLLISKLRVIREAGPIFVPAVGLALAVVGFILMATSLMTGCGEAETASPSTGREPDRTDTVATTQPPAATTPPAIVFGTEKKSAHFESSTPAHGSILPAPPINVVIDFNFDLAPPSEIRIMSGGRDYGVGETKIDEGNLAMRRSLDASAPDGLYNVEYDACWPDGSCHDGHFQFAVDRSQAAGMTDMRNTAEVNVSMSNMAFSPEKMIISPGTKVTWTNKDSVSHFINTDSHPAHTYFPEQNSRGLDEGESFSATFTAPGAYPYHCSAHASQMTGMIVVQ